MIVSLQLLSNGTQGKKLWNWKTLSEKLLSRINYHTGTLFVFLNYLCGIAGALQANLNAEQWGGLLRSMTDSLVHRGRDDAGFWFDAKAGIGLGHRRLSILDISSHGPQPVHSACGRYVIVFNGEIYNFRKIRNEFDEKNIQWRGHSDTEVFLPRLKFGRLKRL